MASVDSERLFRMENSLSRIEKSLASLESLHSSCREEVLGGEQPGRIQRIEAKQMRDSRRLSIVERGLAAIFAVVGFLQIAIPVARAAGWIK